MAETTKKTSQGTKTVLRTMMGVIFAFIILYLIWVLTASPRMKFEQAALNGFKKA